MSARSRARRHARRREEREPPRRSDAFALAFAAAMESPVARREREIERWIARFVQTFNAEAAPLVCEGSEDRERGVLAFVVHLGDAWQVRFSYTHEWLHRSPDEEGRRQAERLLHEAGISHG